MPLFNNKDTAHSTTSRVLVAEVRFCDATAARAALAEGGAEDRVQARCSRLPLSSWSCATVPRQRPPACRRPRYAAAPAFGVNTRSSHSSVAAVHCWRPCLSRGRGASVEQSARFRHGVNFAAHVQATPEGCSCIYCTVREKLLNTGCFRRLEHLPSHVIFCV